MSQEAFKTPMGFRIPMSLYALAVALLITLGSVLGMSKLDIPWWAWCIEFVVIFPIVYSLTKSNSQMVDEASETSVVVNRKKLLGFSVVSAVVVMGLLLLAVF